MARGKKRAEGLIPIEFDHAARRKVYSKLFTHPTAAGYSERMRRVQSFVNAGPDRPAVDEEIQSMFHEAGGHPAQTPKLDDTQWRCVEESFNLESPFTQLWTCAEPGQLRPAPVSGGVIQAGTYELASIYHRLFQFSEGREEAHDHLHALKKIATSHDLPDDEKHLEMNKLLTQIYYWDPALPPLRFAKTQLDSVIQMFESTDYLSLEPYTSLHGDVLLY